MRMLATILLCSAALAQQSITLPRELVDPRAQGAAPAAPAPTPAPQPAPTPQPAPSPAPGGMPASPLPGLGGGAPGQAPQTNEVPIVVVALKASQEGRSTTALDDELKPFQKILETLKPYDTFEIIAQEKKPAPMSRETRFTVNGIYTAYVQPLRTVDAPEGGQRFDLQMRVEMLSGADYIDAIRARGEAAPNQAMLLRGMDLDVGELIVIVMVAPEGDENGNQSQPQQQDQQQEQQEQQDQQQQQQQQGEQDEEKEKEKQEQAEQEERELSNTQGDEQKEPQEEQQEGEKKEDEARALQEQQEKSEGEQEQQQSAQERGEPEDMETIEAILQNLEEKDRQEQKNARYRRSQVIIRGDWW